MDRKEYIDEIVTKVLDAVKELTEVVLENPTNVGKEEIVSKLVESYGRTLFISPAYDVNRQWNEYPDLINNVVFITYRQLIQMSSMDLKSFCESFNLIIMDEAHHTGAEKYLGIIQDIVSLDKRGKIFGITTHTKRYSDTAKDVAQLVFNNHKISGIQLEAAIVKGILPKFDYVSALYDLPKDIADLIARSSIARKIVTDSGLIQVNEEGIKMVIRKHMPEGKRKVVYYVPTVEDAKEAKTLAEELGYGNVYMLNYTISSKDNRLAFDLFEQDEVASLVCISKLNEGKLPKGVNTVVMLRRTVTINIFERQILSALQSSDDKVVVYDFVSNADNLIYSSKMNEEVSRNEYGSRIRSLCSQHIVMDYARPWTSVFHKIRSLKKHEWTESDDNRLRKLYPKYGENVYRYITTHSKMECIVRAELLGLEKVEAVVNPEEHHKMYEVDINEAKEELSTLSLDNSTIWRLGKSYTQVLDDGKVNQRTAGIINLIAQTIPEDLITKMVEVIVRHTHLQSLDQQEFYRKVHTFQDYIYNAYRALKPDEEPEIFIVDKKVINDEASTYKKKKSDEKDAANAHLVMDGKMTSADNAKQLLEQKRMEEKGYIQIGNNWIKKKKSIAGRVGETMNEHNLYGTYRRLLHGKFNIENVNQFYNSYTADEVIEKIRNLREDYKNWDTDDIETIETSDNPAATYSSLLRKYSDLDILETARNTDNNAMILYCEKRTNMFEYKYAKFLKVYREHEKEVEEKEAIKRERARMEEEARQRKLEEEQRMRSRKPIVMVVSMKK